MRTLRTPDVYVKEISLLPPSVTEVATAIPAFVGYTEKAVDEDGISLTNRARRIKNLLEYEQLYGRGPHAVEVETADNAGVKSITKVTLTSGYYLYECLRLYFANRGGPCYIVSVGPYASPAALDDQKLKDGLDTVRKEDEPTLLVVPDAMLVTDADKAVGIAKHALTQSAELMDRIALVDVKMKENEKPTSKDVEDDAKEFRAKIGANNLRYGAAYYPFVRSFLTIRVPYANITWKGASTLLSALHTGEVKTLIESFEAAVTAKNADDIERYEPQVRSVSPLYRQLMEQLDKTRLSLPPTAAIAGVCAWVDDTRGVWKAPANVSLEGVSEPVAKLDAEDQGSFNVDDTGLSINVIRGFYGKGVMVWGARTLAGQDNEWRYVSVRRFFNFAEESIKKATYWAVFETNDANTWVRVKAMIENFLTEQWRAGALQGAKPEQAFHVKCGLGSTMTAQDILAGRMNVEVGMAVVRPAEFIILRFSHKLAVA